MLLFVILQCNLIIFLDNFSIMSQTQLAKKKHQFSDSHSSLDTEATPRTPLSSLSSSLNQQSKQRMVSKYERQLKQKDSELTALEINLNKCRQELTKVNLDNQGLKQENESLKERLNQIDRARQDSQKNTIKEYEVKMSNQLKQITLLQANIGALTEQVISLQDKQALTEKQHKIAIRRWNNTLEQTRSQLQGKLSIKQKQQEKVESLLELKKHELDQFLRDKDQEVMALEGQRVVLREQRDRLQNELMTVQAQKMEEYRLFQSELKSMEQRFIQSKQIHSSLTEAITKSLIRFKDKLNLTSKEDDIPKMIEKFEQELSIRKDPTSYQQTIAKYQQQVIKYQEEVAKYQQQINCHILSEKDLKNKIVVLQDEMAFIRTRNAQSHDFRAVIESHMQQLDSKIVPQTAKKVKPVDNQQSNKPTVISTVPAPQTTLKERHPPINPLNTLNPNINNSLQLPKVAPEYQTERVGRGRSANDFLKEQLQSKKKSLIYIMYRPQHDQQNPRIPHKETHTHSKPQSGVVRKRSNSLGNLISAKCRQRIS